MKEPKAFREKEEIEPGAFLASVSRDKAWIMRGGEREELEILPVGTRTRPAAARAGAFPPPVAAASHPGAVRAVPSAVPYAASPGRTSPDGTQRVAPDGGPSDGEGERIHSSRGKRRRPRSLQR
jgi:hypothetical protein